MISYWTKLAAISGLCVYTVASLYASENYRAYMEPAEYEQHLIKKGHSEKALRSYKSLVSMSTDDPNPCPYFVGARHGVSWTVVVCSDEDKNMTSYLFSARLIHVEAGNKLD